ncbi:hypothetical protein AQJ84_24615 [Streptomyces resistomycificus]|uniref:Aldehyde dehydrogenase domain-containing protein n=1 Tax=Streptomyces resistomycificus TaxID=67356 RepID=A0A0L8L2F9_9ACTN|nr:hypothetical protein ADK37_28105 [Streptomyces resistomycificus]KUN94569.1 hypothetical protein AQJ84_24615 [Streptomyces resistomycificus]
MSVVQDESFGQVLTVERFTSEDEVVRVANDTIYCLAGAVWTTDEAKAARVAGRLGLGTVWINDYHPCVPQAEWGARRTTPRPRSTRGCGSRGSRGRGSPTGPSCRTSSPSTRASR